MAKAPALSSEQARLAALQNIPLFEGLTDAQLQMFARVAVRRSFPRNKTIVYSGDSSDDQSLFVIIRGSVKVLSRDNEGREVILSFIGEGECIGEMALIDGEPRSADVVAFDNCELLEISREDFTHTLMENPELCLSIMRSLVLRLRRATWKIESLALMDTYGRVAKLLLELSEEVDGERQVRRKLTKQDMAKVVGASREMVTRVMKDLETSGHIRQDDGHIIICKQ